MGKKKEYKEANRRFLKKLSFQEGVFALPCGIYYKVLETGEGTISPGARSIVTVHYKGSLIDGREFDNSYERSCPDALRLSDVIEGWQTSFVMHGNNAPRTRRNRTFTGLQYFIIDATRQCKNTFLKRQVFQKSPIGFFIFFLLSHKLSY